MNWKRIILEAIALYVLTVLGTMIGYYFNALYLGFDWVATIVIIIGFAVSSYYAKKDRMRHLIFVGVLYVLIGILGIILNGGSAGQSVVLSLFWTILTATLGGYIGFLIARSQRGRK